MTPTQRLEEMAATIWEHIRQIPCNSVFATDVRPSIEVCPGTHRGALASTNFGWHGAPAKVRIWAGTTGGMVRLHVLVHEFIHARGFRHGTVLGKPFPTWETKDMASPYLIQKMGLQDEQIPLFTGTFEQHSSYIKGKSCRAQGRKCDWQDKGNYFKCPYCGSSKTKRNKLV